MVRRLLLVASLLLSGCDPEAGAFLVRGSAELEGEPLGPPDSFVVKGTRWSAAWPELEISLDERPLGFARLEDADATLCARGSCEPLAGTLFVAEAGEAPSDVERYAFYLEAPAVGLRASVRAER